MERLYVGSWVFNTKRPTRDFSPGGADRNIDLAAWIEDALNNNLIALPTTESDTIYTSDGIVSENRYAQLSNNKKKGNNPSDTINTFKVLGSSYANSAAAITGGVAVGEIWYNTTTNKFNVRLV